MTQAYQIQVVMTFHAFVRYKQTSVTRWSLCIFTWVVWTELACISDPRRDFASGEIWRWCSFFSRYKSLCSKGASKPKQLSYQYNHERDKCDWLCIQNRLAAKYKPIRHLSNHRMTPTASAQKSKPERKNVWAPVENVSRDNFVG